MRGWEMAQGKLPRLWQFRKTAADDVNTVGGTGRGSDVAHHVDRVDVIGEVIHVIHLSRRVARVRPKVVVLHKVHGEVLSKILERIPT